jgi:hypothetical protein
VEITAVRSVPHLCPRQSCTRAPGPLHFFRVPAAPADAC